MSDKEPIDWEKRGFKVWKRPVILEDCTVYYCGDPELSMQSHERSNDLLLWNSDGLCDERPIERPLGLENKYESKHIPWSPRET